MKKRFLLAALAAVASLSLVSCASDENTGDSTPSLTPTPTPTPSVEEHVHDYDTEWSKNEKLHWYACECDENLLKDAAPHNDGDNNGECDDCKYVYDASHQHAYSSEWASDSTGHWLEANCGHDLTKDFAAHGNANKLGNCPTCGYHLEDVIPATVEEAIELGVSQAANIKNGQFKNGGMTVYYEYADGGLTYSDSTGTYYFYPYGDSVFGVCESTYNGTYAVDTTGKELEGYKFDANDIGYSDTYLYGAEELLVYMYAIGSGNYNGDFKEEVKDVDGKKVYTFSFSDYNAESENYYKYFYEFNVSFTLAESCEIDKLNIDLIAYSDSGYDWDWNRVEYVTLDETTGYYVLSPDAPIDTEKTISYDNNYEDAKPSYNPEYSLANDFELYIYNEGQLGDKITDTINVTSGVQLQIALADITPDTFVADLNEVKFYINDEECDYDHQILYAYNWGDYVQLSGHRAGTYELTVKYGNATKTYSVVISQPDPTEINATYSSTDTGFSTSDTAVEIYAGNTINISASVNEFANASFTASVESADATLTLVEGTDYYTFSSNVPGEYVITVTSTVVPTLTSTITIKVVEAPNAADLLVGTWQYEFYGSVLYKAVFTPASEGAANGTVELSYSTVSTGVYTYAYDDATGLTLTYASGTDQTGQHTLIIKDFKLFAVNANYGYEYELVQVSTGSGDGSGSEQASLEDHLTTNPNWVSADGNVTVSIEYNSTFSCWSATITDSVSGTIAAADFQVVELNTTFNSYPCTTEYSIIVEGSAWNYVNELEFSSDLNTLTIYFDEYNTNITFTSVSR